MIISEENEAELYEALTRKNNLSFNKLKVIEEATELNELLIKSLTKINPLKPIEKRIIEEIADLNIRLQVLVDHMDIWEEVESAVDNKLQSLYVDYKAGKFGTKIDIKR